MKVAQLVFAALIGLSGCSGDGLTTADSLNQSGLVQIVTLSSATVAVGEALTVRSVVINRGRSAAAIETSCVPGVWLTGLQFTPLAPGDGECAGGNGWFLRRGDSVVQQSTTRAVTSPPGNYTVLVRQLLSPSSGVQVRIQVVAAVPRAAR